MDKFYAGGFLYDQTTHRVLLHERDDKTKASPNMWAFFGGTSKKSERPLDTFCREVAEELDITLNERDVQPLCDYFNSDFDIHRYVFWIEFSSTHTDFRLQEGRSYRWIDLDLAFDLNLSKSTIQDLKLFESKVTGHTVIA